jgi:hypothetical protein
MPEQKRDHADYSLMMLIRTYIEALLVDPEAADQVWESWNAGVLDDALAILSWSVICQLTEGGNAD